jgi:hypothetical protein
VGDCVRVQPGARAARGSGALIALVTSEELPGLEPDSRLLLPALDERGIDARPVVWTDADVDWSSFDAVIVRSPWE